MHETQEVRTSLDGVLDGSVYVATLELGKHVHHSLVGLFKAHFGIRPVTLC
jgi:hypothetical protein